VDSQHENFATVTEHSTKLVREMVDAVYRSDSRQVLATLIRLLGDFDAAEEALHDAFRCSVFKSSCSSLSKRMSK
jgi:hypothetical protein